MAGPFEYFVIFAEMRTGSNFLETNLNAFDHLLCHGEAFNPHFIGYPNRDTILGLTQADRDTDPLKLLAQIRTQPDALGGFRYFHDHDPRILEKVLNDPACAKIVLTRNPLDSYVSWKIAQATGQWKLTDVKRRKEAKAQFDAAEFTRHIEALQNFQVSILKQLQITGQTAFHLAYEDLQDLDVMNGLAQWLGLDQKLDALDKSLKPQNPAPITAKVANPEEMALGLSQLDRFNLHRTPNFEPRRGPAVPTYVATHKTPLMYLPMRGGPEVQVTTWLASLDDVDPDHLLTGMNQKQMRQWKRAHKGHRSFTVLGHPVARAYQSFCTRILMPGSRAFPHVRETIKKQFKIPLPKGAPGKSYTADTHRAAFEGYLRFVRANLAGQTGIRVDAAWATQTQVLSGFGELVLPDHVFRPDELEIALPALAAQVGAQPLPVPSATDTGTDTETGTATGAPYLLSEIYDDALEKQVKDIYQRDYLMFGFGAWSGGP